MFRASICLSSGVCDYVVELPHWPFRSWFIVCWSYAAVRLGWYPNCRLKPDTTLAEPQHNSNTQQTKNETANVVVQQQSQPPEDRHIDKRNMLSL